MRMWHEDKAKCIAPVELPYLLPVTYISMSAASSLLILLVRFPMGEPHWTAILKPFLIAGAVMLTWQEVSRQVLRGQWCSYALALLAIFSVLFSPVFVWFDVGVWVAIVLAAGALLYPVLMALERPITISGGAILILLLALLSESHFRNGPSKLLSLLSGLGQDKQPQWPLSPVGASWVSLFDPYDPFRALIADRVAQQTGGQLKQTLIEAGLPVRATCLSSFPQETRLSGDYNTSVPPNHSSCRLQSQHP